MPARRKRCERQISVTAEVFVLRSSINSPVIINPAIKASCAVGVVLFTSFALLPIYILVRV
jgi:hypothetical protein